MHDILAAREYRWNKRLSIAEKTGCSTICLTLNIPGPDKNISGADKAIIHLSKEIISVVESNNFPIIYKELEPSADGCFFIMAVDCPADILKACMVSIEDSHPLGRLADIDIISSDGTVYDRAHLKLPPRRCFICLEEAAICVRTRAHPSAQVLEAVRLLLNPY
ncbi:citrate lyase holo-[acyl-carrier protein] synthase [Rhodobacteraceae bacterium RKSG542]|uniref:citrate lyase holo-[acyl-carrier protein] synthase n=1 Tax=Pseudovibrio flavus TaxID=2529854 RepID=UPI0012BC2E88|nr:citrate lyase holo-[acyl-carrier protein] synthase [Pseudovibrio flavus]MTI15938.1 citrate lyase holo-[acyl-carrier protein] synthase [Pseudovibrio flavus]